MKDFKKYITDKKEISAGFLFETPEGFLLVHPTARAKGKGNWDIPKGHIETGEYPLEAAIRELKEETGLDYNPDWETTLYYITSIARKCRMSRSANVLHISNSMAGRLPKMMILWSLRNWIIHSGLCRRS